jgi:uncharacterized membrane protein
MFRFLARIFLAGVFTILPLVITVAVVVWVAGIVNGFLGPGTVLGGLLARLGLRFSQTTAFAYVIGWLIALAVVFGLGILVEFGAKRWINERMDGIARRVPMLGGVYGTVRQLVGMMDAKDRSELKGMSVVFCVFGEQTGAAFLALLVTPEAFRIGEIDYHAVLVPTAPVPVGGSLMFVPVSAVRPASVSVDAFMSIYVSMGVTGPQFLQAAQAKNGP